MAERFGFDVDVPRCRMGHRRSGRDLCREACRRQGAPDQGGVRHPQRDRDRRDQRCRAPCAPRSMPPAIRRCCSSMASPRSARSISARTNGASIAPSPARRRASCCPPASASCRSARRRWRPPRPQVTCRCYFSFEDMIKHQRHRLFPLHAADAAAARPARFARPDLRGRPGEHLRPPSPPRRGRAQGGRRLGPAALRQGAEVALRHGQRDPSCRKAWTAPRWSGAPTTAYNTSLGIGLSKVAGKVFRIGHLGWLNEVMVLRRAVGGRNGAARLRREGRSRARASALRSSISACRHGRRSPRRPEQTSGRTSMSHTIHHLRKLRLQRSELAVPGSNPDDDRQGGRRAPPTSSSSTSRTPWRRRTRSGRAGTSSRR